MSNYTQTSVNELRAILVKSGTMTQEQADAIKGKSNLVAAVLALEDKETTPIFDLPESPLDIVDSIIKKVESNVEDPTPLDEGWNDYVLKQFAKDELFEGNPKLSGLRRVTEKLIGKIISTGPVSLNPATDPTNPGRASVMYRVVIEDHFGNILDFSAVGGAYPGNMNDEYGVYPECIAENRAEARALRRALRLSAVSAEEITNKDTKEIVRQFTSPKSSDNEWKESSSISEMQAIFLTKKTTELGVDLNKFLNGRGHAEMKDMTRQNALDAIDLLNKYADKSLVIPEEIKV